MTTVWTILLNDDAGGWVMGVFSTRDRAMAAISAHEEEQGNPLTWVQVQEQYAEAHGLADDDRFIVTSYQLDEMGV